MLGINRSNIIICTGLICALLSYAEWAQIAGSLGTHPPLVWNWAKVQKFLVTTYSDLPSGLCALKSMDYIGLPNGTSGYFCLLGKKEIKWKSAIHVDQKNGHNSGLQSPLWQHSGLSAILAVCALWKRMCSFQLAVCLPWPPRLRLSMCQNFCYSLGTTSHRNLLIKKLSLSW